MTHQLLAFLQAMGSASIEPPVSKMLLGGAVSIILGLQGWAVRTARQTRDDVRTLHQHLFGAAVGDAVLLGPPSTLEADLVATGYVSAADTVTVRLSNPTGSPIDPASATWRATVVKA